MKLLNGFTHLVTITLFLCESVLPITLLKEQTGDVQTNFVSAVQIKEMEKDSEENTMDHKLKMSVVDKTDPESLPKNIVYLLKDKELKGFLRTLPIEMLRKLRTLASRDMESAQNFLIKLARERRRTGRLENTEYIGSLSSEAKPLISSRNFSRSFILNNTELLNKGSIPYSNSRFLSDYKFRQDKAENSRQEEMQRGQSKWSPVTASPMHENTSTVTYIVHEVVYPKDSNQHPSSTTEIYPSLQKPIRNPTPTTPAFIKSPSYNYRPTVLHPENTISKQKSALLDNYYGASRQVKGGNQQGGQMTGGNDNNNENPTVLLPHLPYSEYGWSISHVNSPSTNSFNMNNFNSNRGPADYEKQEFENSEYIGAGNKNMYEGPSSFLHNQQIMNMHSNQPNYHAYPSPSSYYTMKPFMTSANQNPGGYSTTTNTNYVYHNQDNGIGQSHSNSFHGWNDNVSGGDSYKGLWSKTKSYFSKGDRTVAEKVFEISLGILAFLAFGGYICMLVYQVFAATSIAPLFPIVTQTIPVRPSLLGILFGRSFNSPNGSSLLDSYLNKLEKNVKLAVKHFRAKYGDKEI